MQYLTANVSNKDIRTKRQNFNHGHTHYILQCRTDRSTVYTTGGDLQTDAIS